MRAGGEREIGSPVMASWIPSVALDGGGIAAERGQMKRSEPVRTWRLENTTKLDDRHTCDPFLALAGEQSPRLLPPEADVRSGPEGGPRRLHAGGAHASLP